MGVRCVVLCLQSKYHAVTLIVATILTALLECFVMF